MINFITSVSFTILLIPSISSLLTVSSSAKTPTANRKMKIVNVATYCRIERISTKQRVTQGGNRVQHVDPRILHCRANHRQHEQVTAWHKCSNAPMKWKTRNCACDDCLMSTADKVTHQDKSPKVEAPGDLLSFDVFSLGVPHVHGGQTKVLGIHDHFSGFNWVDNYPALLTLLPKMWILL